MLTLRQTELQFQRAENDVKVQVRNAVISLQQARARYENAVASRKLAEQTLEAEQMRFKFGESTIATVVQSQRDLATNQTAEIQSIANYTHAKIAFDQALGQTLEVNHVSIEEATAGRVQRESLIPSELPKAGGTAMNTRQTVAFIAAWGCLLAQLQAQQPFVERPQNKIVWRPYMRPKVPPAVMTNSDRIRSLIRAGTLYLTLQDTIALAVENNLDLQVDRYGPLRAEWTVERQQAGGPLKGSTSSPGAGSITVSGQGVAGAEQSAGVSNNGGNNSAGQATEPSPRSGP